MTEELSTRSGGGVDSLTIAAEVKKALDWLKSRSGVTSVNGKVGDVTLVDLIYPVGSIYISVNSTNPGNIFGGTWIPYSQGRMLFGASDSHPVGETGGEETHVLTADEMPSHGHGGSTDSTGSHSHTRGSMNITGKFGLDGIETDNGEGDKYRYYSGAFYKYSTTTAKHNAHNAGGWTTDIVGFYGSDGWSGSTSSSGSHSHSVSISNTGGGVAHNNMPPYLAVNVWLRTA